jgi:beta-N-acetylhexosaminidase
VASLVALAAAATVLVVVLALRSSSTRPPAPAHPTVLPDTGRLLGQMIVARFSGASPSASFLARIRAGQIGGVILFADNVAVGSEATRRLTRALQRAARSGGNPPLLIMTDQEGGPVNRLRGAPRLPAREMGSPATARAQGHAAGRLLRSVGINLDLAPVADVERLPGSFLGTRSFGSDPQRVAARACAFARGLASEGVGYTLKHFPGLGWAPGSTDIAATVVAKSAGTLQRDYGAYAQCGADPRALVMVNSAIYPGLSGPAPAVLSPEIYRREIPDVVGRGVVTVSDDLEAAALAGQPRPALRAINAGLDLLLYAGTEAGSTAAYQRLLTFARTGEIDRARIRGAWHAVTSLKRLIAAPPTP